LLACVRRYARNDKTKEINTSVLLGSLGFWVNLRESRIRRVKLGLAAPGGSRARYQMVSSKDTLTEYSKMMCRTVEMPTDPPQGWLAALFILAPW
jgi:hypothetical protein